MWICFIKNTYNFLYLLGPIARTCNPSKWEAEDDLRPGGLLCFTTQWTSISTGLADSMVTLGKSGAQWCDCQKTPINWMRKFCHGMNFIQLTGWTSCHCNLTEKFVKRMHKSFFKYVFNEFPNIEFLDDNQQCPITVSSVFGCK